MHLPSVHSLSLAVAGRAVWRASGMGGVGSMKEYLPPCRHYRRPSHVPRPHHPKEVDWFVASNATNKSSFCWPCSPETQLVTSKRATKQQIVCCSPPLQDRCYDRLVVFIILAHRSLFDVASCTPAPARSSITRPTPQASLCASSVDSLLLKQCPNLGGYFSFSYFASRQKYDQKKGSLSRAMFFLVQ